MKGKVRITMKPKVEPYGPGNLQSMKPYRVVEVREGFIGVEAGDIVLRFLCRSDVSILNCTKGTILLERASSGTGWNGNFQCLRAFDIKEIVLCFDEEDKSHA